MYGDLYYELIETHQIALHVNGNNTIYFDSFAVEHIPKEIKTFIEHINMITKVDK